MLKADLGRHVFEANRCSLPQTKSTPQSATPFVTEAWGKKLLYCDYLIALNRIKTSAVVFLRLRAYDDAV